MSEKIIFCFVENKEKVFLPSKNSNRIFLSNEDFIEEKDVFFNKDFIEWKNYRDGNEDPGKKFFVVSCIHKTKEELLMNTCFPYYRTFFYISKNEKKCISEMLESLNDEIHSKESLSSKESYLEERDSLEEEDEKTLEKVIFDGDKQGNTLSMKNIFSYLNKNNGKYILKLFDYLQRMLDAGYHKEENLEMIEDYIVSCITPIMFRFIEIFKFNVDEGMKLTNAEIFCQNPQFRKSLCDTMINSIIFCLNSREDIPKKKISKLLNGGGDYFLEKKDEIREMIIS